MIAFRLVSVGMREGEDRLIEARRLPEVGGDRNRISGASVASGEQLTAKVGVTFQPRCGQRREIK